VLVIPRSEFRQLLAIFPEFGATLSDLAAKREVAR
jgi:CRP-like cAMP-binding protein